MDTRAGIEPKHAYAAMDAMRALAAALVAISHIRDLFMQNYTGNEGILVKVFYFVTGFGHAGVVIFFVLSGFWIAKSVARRVVSPDPFWSAFLIDRLSRLWLVLLPVLLFGGLCDWYGSQILSSPIYLGSSGALSLTKPIILSPLVFLANAFFLQTLAAPILGSNGPLWSVAYEFWYYLWFPAIWLAFKRRPSIFILSPLIAILNPLVLFGFVSWLCGSVLYAMIEFVKRAPIRRTTAAIICIAGGIATVAMLVVMRVHPIWWLDPLLAAAFAALLLGLGGLDLKIPGLRPFAAFGAKSSFSLYAVHFPLAALAASFIVRGGRMPASGTAVALVLAVLGGIIGCSFLFSKATEAHTFRVRRALTNGLSWRAAEPVSLVDKDMAERIDEAG